MREKINVLEKAHTSGQNGIIENLRERKLEIAHTMGKNIFWQDAYSGLRITSDTSFVPELKLVDLHLTPENMINFEEFLNNERKKYNSRLHKDNQFYIDFLSRTTFTRNNGHFFSSSNVNKMIYFTFDDIKKEWRIRGTGRH